MQQFTFTYHLSGGSINCVHPDDKNLSVDEKHKKQYKVIVRNGIITTSDPREAEAIRAYPKFGINIHDMGSVDLEVVDKYGPDKKLFEKLSSMKIGTLKSIAKEKELIVKDNKQVDWQAIMKQTKDSIIELMLERKHLLGEYAI